jgi:hypothetical protein
MRYLLSLAAQQRAYPRDRRRGGVSVSRRTTFGVLAATKAGAVRICPARLDRLRRFGPLSRTQGLAGRPNVPHRSQPAPKGGGDSTQNETEGDRIVPAQGFTQVDIRKHGKDDESDDLLDDFQLVARELSVANPVCGHLKTVLAKTQ